MPTKEFNLKDIEAEFGVKVSIKEITEKLTFIEYRAINNESISNHLPINLRFAQIYPKAISQSAGLMNPKGGVLELNKALLSYH